MQLAYQTTAAQGSIHVEDAPRRRRRHRSPNESKTQNPGFFGSGRCRPPGVLRGNGSRRRARDRRGDAKSVALCTARSPRYPAPRPLEPASKPAMGSARPRAAPNRHPPKERATVQLQRRERAARGRRGPNATTDAAALEAAPRGPRSCCWASRRRARGRWRRCSAAPGQRE